MSHADQQRLLLGIRRLLRPRGECNAVLRRSWDRVPQLLLRHYRDPLATIRLHRQQLQLRQHRTGLRYHYDLAHPDCFRQLLQQAHALYAQGAP